ncbi:MAG: hypothetical protein WCO08_02190 [Actinomycetes bacterium]
MQTTKVGIPFMHNNSNTEWLDNVLTFEDENSFVELNNREILHMIWLGPPVPDSVAESVSLWRKIFPGVVKLWKEEDLSRLPKGPWSNQDLHPAQRADYLRVFLVYKFGGWYSDVDCRPGKVALPPADRVRLAREDGRRFINCLFCGPKKHPFMLHWLRELGLSSIESAHDSIPEKSGPFAISRALYSYSFSKVAVDNAYNIYVLPWTAFTHLPGNLFFKSGSIPFFGKYALHFGESTWSASTKRVTNLVLIKRFFYLLRHSSMEPIFEVLRLLVTRKVPKRKSLPWRPFLRGVLSSDLSYIQQVSTSYSSEDLLEMSEVDIARNLNLQILELSQNKLLAKTLKNSGWENYRFNKFNFLVRPKITSLLSQKLLNDN